MAAIASFIESCKLNNVDPQAYFADVVARIVVGWTLSQIEELLGSADAPTPLMAMA